MTTNDPGTVVTTGSPSANNYLAVTPSDENTDNSLQAPSLLFNDTGSGWGYTTATAGSINTGQTTGDITLPVELSLFQAVGGNREVNLNWATSSEVENLGFEIERAMTQEGPYELISSYISNPDLEGQINSNQETRYRYVDRGVANGTTYWYPVGGRQPERHPYCPWPDRSHAPGSQRDGRGFSTAPQLSQSVQSQHDPGVQCGRRDRAKLRGAPGDL